MKRMNWNLACSKRIKQSKESILHRELSSLSPFLKAHQALLAWTIKGIPIRQELCGQVLGPIQYPLLRHSLSHVDMKTYDAFIRPILIGDRKKGKGTVGAKRIEEWMNNARFQAFIRREYLKRKSATISSDSSFSYLPTWKREESPSFDQVIQAFGLQGWNRQAGTAIKEDKKREELLRRLIKGGDSSAAAADLSTWSLEDILELGGACVWGRGAFNVYCEEEGYWDVWTREYIEGLASYLTQRVQELSSSSSSPSSPTLVLEIGAGNGLLAHHLKSYLDPKLIRYIATDQTITNQSLPHVERLDYKKALQRYPAPIIICSWMPMGEDWTASIRQVKRRKGRSDERKDQEGEGEVEEYILIGESGADGCCGDPVLTWGAGTPRNRQPLYEVEGYQRQALDHLSTYQLSRYDSEAYARNSSTISFRGIRRQKPIQNDR